MVDLDKGGRLPQNVKTNLGPSVGWKYTDSPVDIEFVIDGVGSAIGPGLKPIYRSADWLTINSWAIYANIQSGSVVFDIWKVSQDQYAAGTIPSVANTICGSAKPTLSGAQYATSSTLTGWTKQINQNDILALNIDSVASLTGVTLVLTCIRNIGPS